MTTEQQTLSAAERENVLRRVQKLLAIAQDDRANPNEAAAAASQAEKIMRKYQIDNAEAIASRISKGDDLDTSTVVATAKDNGTPVEKIPPWAQWLAVAVAELNDCGARNGFTQTTKGQEACIRFYGYTEDVQVAAWMFDYLVATTNRLCKEFRKDDRYLQGGRAVMNSYRQGVSQGILSSVQALTRAKRAEVVTGTGLMVIKQRAITEKYGDFGYKSRPITTRSGDAFSAGREVGKRVDVNRRGVGHTGNSQQRIGSN